MGEAEPRTSDTPETMPQDSPKFPTLRPPEGCPLPQLSGCPLSPCSPTSPQLSVRPSASPNSPRLTGADVINTAHHAVQKMLWASESGPGSVSSDRLSAKDRGSPSPWESHHQWVKYF
eukprot:NODE_7981_length_429_cov_46.302632_g7121_i0.p1 GENE.NODE_7981_length_429_cov_46.302632_g7121_i0~~NODE_7981_length_429_cov_46.302632_g7121_i0.p1  ORF type:complete len:127 (+),score=37.63 NODE_7981_length_429_cov_46.302632_g7121_i0:28-381(+)